MAIDGNGKFFMDEFDYEDLREAVNTLVYFTHRAALESGWWDGYDWSDVHKQNTKVTLIANEVFEAQEAIRVDSNDNHLPQYKGVLTELIDVLVRSGDTLGRYQDDDSSIDPGKILVDKMKYNERRTDHRPDERKKPGGKRF